jgi:hypothetical protein
MEPAELWSLAGLKRVMGADDDVVTLERTLALYRGLPHAQLAIVPVDPPRRAVVLECGSAVGDGEQDGDVF